jgi:hypothetical protein
MSFTMTVDTARVMAALEKRSAAAVQKRAERLGQVAVADIRALIQAEIGFEGGSRGMTPLWGIPFRAEVDSGTTLPIVVTVSAVVDGATAGKFGAHNNGCGPHDIPGPLTFEGTKKAAGRWVVVRAGRHARHPGTPGKDWIRRGMAGAVAKLRAGFIR